MQNRLTPNYIALNANRDNYISGLAVVLGPYTLQLAATRTKASAPVRVDLAHISDLIDSAATAASRIIAEYPAALHFATTQDDYRDSRGDALCTTFTRDIDLAEQGCLDATGRCIAGEILERARQRFSRPEAANIEGLAMLDMFLVEMAEAIKPLVATQAELDWVYH